MSYVVKINDTSVDLSPDTAVQLSLPNPYLLYDRIEGPQAKFPSLPFTPNNQKTFGFWQMPMAGGDLREYRCRHYYGGELIQDGYFYLTDAGESGFQGVFSARLGKFFGDHQNTRLSELNFGSIALPGVLTPVVAEGGQNALCFPVIHNPTYYGQNTYSGYMNEYTLGAYTGAPQVPMVFVHYLIGRIAELTGISIDGSFLTDTAWQQAILYNTRALDGATSVVIANHLPELTVTEFFLELRKLLNLAYTFDTITKRLTMGFWDDSLRLPTQVDWSKKAVKGGNKIPEVNTRLQLSYVLDGGDALMKNRPADVADYLTAETEGLQNGIAKLPVRFSTLLTEAGLATAQQQGATSLYGQQANTFSPRLLFWNGIVTGLPRALPTLNGISLYWNGPNGLAATYWAQLEALRKRQFYLKKQFVLTESDLATLDLSRKVHVDGVDYLIAQLEVQLPLSKPCESLLLGGV